MPLAGVFLFEEMPTTAILFWARKSCASKVMEFMFFILMDDILFL